MRIRIVCCLLVAGLTFPAFAAEPVGLEQEPNTWVKRSPLTGGPVSPSMGYETSLGYDPVQRRLIRWGGHNQGGGGEQNAETWVFDPLSARWALKEPNTSPPGVCCAQQNLFDPIQNRFLRFPAFSGSHGWHWYRENYLSNSTLWNYDLAGNTWRDLRPVPTPRVSPLRCASWDSEHQVAVIFGGEGNQEGTVVYDPYVNRWTWMKPKVQPAFRSGGNMTYDAFQRRHVLFGSQFSDDPHTWTYDLRKNEWRDMQPAVQPPSNRNDAVLAYDPNGKVVIALVRAIDKLDRDEILAGHLETWAYDTGKNTWTHLKPTLTPDGKGNRRRVMIAIPEMNVLIMEAYVNPTERVPKVDREQQMWTYRFAAKRAEAAPLPPRSIKVQTDAGAAQLRWQVSPSADVAAYVVLRGSGTSPWQVDLKQVARVEGNQTSFADRTVQPGTIYHYAVRAVNRAGTASTDSVKIRTQPRIVEDAVVSVLKADEIQLTWTPPAEHADIAGYHVERALVAVFSDDQILRLKKDTAPLATPSVGSLKMVGPFVRLTEKPIEKTAFTDTTINLTELYVLRGDPLFTHRFRPDQLDAEGKPYRLGVCAYRIRAVNRLGVEGGDSPLFLTIPSSPRSLFSKEEGAKCHLKWAKNPEKGLQGYRVYRMEGPKVNGPGQPVTRLTAAPISGTSYSDDKAGTDTRRFWIVAVDALGQEGIPSAPTWHHRQFRKFYLPFVGEWHQ